MMGQEEGAWEFGHSCINGDCPQFGHGTARGITNGLGLRSYAGLEVRGHSLLLTLRLSRSKQVDKAEGGGGRGEVT